jgi:hypothetical protein
LAARLTPGAAADVMEFGEYSKLMGKAGTETGRVAMLRIVMAGTVKMLSSPTS